MLHAGGNWTTLGTSNITSFFASNLVIGMHYSFRVRAYNDFGISTPSNTVLAVAAAPPLPPVPPVLISLQSYSAITYAAYNLSRSNGYGPSYGSWFIVQYTSDDPNSRFVQISRSFPLSHTLSLFILALVFKQ